jgi:hypothetical protein
MSQPNFIGHWKLNHEQSKLQIPPPTSSMFEIEHSEPKFRLTRTLVYGEQSNTITLDLTIDGEEHKHEIGDVNARIRLYWDGDILVGDMQVAAKDDEATNVVRYSLENGGQTLVAHERFRSSKQSYDNVWVLNKYSPDTNRGRP